MIAKYHCAAGLPAHALAGCGTKTTTTALADRHGKIINNSGDTTTDFQRSTAGASTRKRPVWRRISCQRVVPFQSIATTARAFAILISRLLAKAVPNRLIRRSMSARRLPARSTELRPFGVVKAAYPLVVSPPVDSRHSCMESINSLLTCRRVMSVNGPMGRSDREFWR